MKRRLCTHIRGNSCTVFDCVALYSDVVDLSVCVSEYKMLPGWNGLADLWLALCILQETVVGKKNTQTEHSLRQEHVRISARFPGWNVLTGSGHLGIQYACMLLMSCLQVNNDFVHIWNMMGSVERVPELIWQGQGTSLKKKIYKLNVCSWNTVCSSVFFFKFSFKFLHSSFSSNTSVLFC